MKILIVRFSSIGDIVLTTPVIRCLGQQLGAEIHFITKKQFSPALEANPYIHKIHTIEKSVHEIAGTLRKERFDFIADLHNNLRSLQLKSILRRKSKAFYKTNFEKWLFVNLRLNFLPKVHIVDRYFETVRHLGVQNDGAGLDYFIPTKDEVNIKSLPSEFNEGYTGFVIGAGHGTKRLPEEKIVSVIRKLNSPVVLLGGKEDEARGARIVSSLGAGSPVYNACGKYSLNESASLVKQANKIITNDTGLMHIAAAFKKEIVSVWGNTVPEFGMGPYYGSAEIRNSKFEIRNLSCRPCSKLGYEKCPRGHFKCMNEINDQEIVDSIR